MKTNTRILVGGAIAGALLGAAAAYMYLRSVSPEPGSDDIGRLPSIHPGKAIAVGLSALTLMRQVVGLGQRG
jgi:hypothetical protein